MTFQRDQPERTPGLEWAEHAYRFVESGWCSRCGMFSSVGGHRCPDGTKPVSLNPGPDNADLFREGTMK